ncbi:AMP-binding protein [Achromobacter xylosoxidans]|uniref:AMP-binding protein n=1 Tax=Alcaligenes xylosoxydans xylosoxydans TaxID=85698 RepID=UPI001EEAA14C|nr:AMP-binding protein [Achromobacter xylosoxidans]
MAWTALTHLLLPQAAPAGDARVADEPALSRREFAAQCLAVAGALQARGARRAALWFEDAVALAIALFACGRAGITAVLPADVRPDTCAALDADIWLSDAAALPPACQAWRLEQLQHAPALPPAVLDPAQRLVLWTSGSSGAPKPVGKSWDQLMREVEALRQQWPDDGGPVLGSVSAQHMYGLPYRVLWPLCAGRPIDRPQRLYPEELQQASLRHATFTWIASPALLRRLGERLDGSRLRGRLVRLYCAGGSCRRRWPNTSAANWASAPSTSTAVPKPDRSPGAAARTRGSPWPASKSAWTRAARCARRRHGSTPPTP